MENTTKFDLNGAITQWRSELSGCPSFEMDHLDEMERHIRDSSAALETLGLPAEEAYWLALRRLGSPETLDKEFRKVHTQRVWLDRITWSIAFYIIYVIFLHLAGLIATATSALSYSLYPGLPHSWVRWGVILIIMTIAAIFVYRGTARGFLGRFHRWATLRPFVSSLVLALLLILLTVANQSLLYFVLQPVISRPEVNTNELRAQAGWAGIVVNLTLPFLLAFLWIPVLGFLLRRSHKLSAERQLS